MPTPGQELSSIDFESMLGGPLIAVVHAQAQAALSTVNFIKQVGFKPGPANQTPSTQSVGDPIYVDFTYPKELSPFEPGPPAVPATYQEQKLSVPILTLLPIPYLRIADTTIDFKAKIDSIEYRKTDETINVGGELEASAGWGWGSAKLKVSASYQKNTQEGNQVTRTYSMDIHIHAVQEDMPAGMEKMLSILESAIRAQPASAPPPTPSGAITPPPTT